MIHFSKVREAYRPGDVEQVGDARRRSSVPSHPDLSGVDSRSTEISKVPTLEVCGVTGSPFGPPARSSPWNGPHRIVVETRTRRGWGDTASAGSRGYWRLYGLSVRGDVGATPYFRGLPVFRGGRTETGSSGFPELRKKRVSTTTTETKETLVTWIPTPSRTPRNSSRSHRSVFGNSWKKEGSLRWKALPLSCWKRSL